MLRWEIRLKGLNWNKREIVAFGLRDLFFVRGQSEDVNMKLTYIDLSGQSWV